MSRKAGEDEEADDNADDDDDNDCYFSEVPCARTVCVHPLWWTTCLRAMRASPGAVRADHVFTPLVDRVFTYHVCLSEAVVAAVVVSVILWQLSLFPSLFLWLSSSFSPSFVRVV